jgi:hypothetical protein
MSLTIAFTRRCTLSLLLAALPGCVRYDDSMTEWCVNIEQAQMWPIDQPELATFVYATEGGPPAGCLCFDEAESQVLRDRTPGTQYDELVDELEEAARHDCAWVVPSGNDYSCFIEDGPLAPNLTEPYSDAHDLIACG